MTTELLVLCVTILMAAGAGGLLCCREIARVHGGYANIKCLIILNYVLIQPVSGIVHLTRGEAAFRGGYYNLLTSDPHFLLMATANCVLGMIGLCFACMQGLQAQRRREVAISSTWLGVTELWIICIALALITVPALNATVMMMDYAAQTGATRLINLDVGLGRYSFLANWLAWVISFVALLLVARQKAPPPFAVLAVTGVAVVLIAASFNWLGGRSIGLLMSLPLILVLWPRLKSVRWLALPIGAAALIAYVVAVSEARMGGLARGPGVSPVNWLDWEWGRFSMSGFAADFVKQDGFLYGETFLRGIAAVVLAPLEFVGISVPDVHWRNTMEISGMVLLGNSKLNYIVPGLNAELYINFGLPGVLVGFYILGRACVIVDNSIIEARLVLERIALTFIGAVLVLRTLPADSGALYTFALYSGLPLLACAVVARWLSPTRQKGGRPSLVYRAKSTR